MQAKPSIARPATGLRRHHRPPQTALALPLVQLGSAAPAFPLKELLAPFLNLEAADQQRLRHCFSTLALSDDGLGHPGLRSLLEPDADAPVYIQALQSSANGQSGGAAPHAAQQTIFCVGAVLSFRGLAAATRPRPTARLQPLHVSGAAESPAPAATGPRLDRRSPP